MVAMDNKSYYKVITHHFQVLLIIFKVLSPDIFIDAVAVINSHTATITTFYQLYVALISLYSLPLPLHRIAFHIERNPNSHRFHTHINSKQAFQEPGPQQSWSSLI
jgi:hypothetical protein